MGYKLRSDLIKWDDHIYDGEDLGATYNKDFTIFKVWAPSREDIKLIIYESHNDSQGKIYSMIRRNDGVWELRLDGDYGNKYYNYIVSVDGMYIETPDPYTKGATANGKRGMIVDFSSVNPEGWKNHKVPGDLDLNQTIIYEMHVRDFSMDRFSGIKSKGKYLAFTEKDTRGMNGIYTGLDHLLELGVTHLHLMPVFDFASVDETKLEEYNWGYDPYLYNVPEGSYSTDPFDGRARIREFKEMIRTLHENDIRVIMDVVYNHTFSQYKNPFQILEPEYYYRRNEHGEYTNGSGCGNETASERAMMRKFIIDSVKFWAREYKIDGFRFDLMALHDINTMKQIEQELKKINPGILLYGEPWTGGNSSLAYDMQFRKGKQRGTQIAVFNDDFRNAIKGDNNGNARGFVNGQWGLEFEIKKGIIGSIKYNEELMGFSDEPYETINYVSCHDNLTLFDKFEKSNPEYSYEERRKMNRLALAIILTSQGIPFIQGGTELLRSKKGNDNSYNAGDYINNIEWNRKSEYNDTFKYLKDLISLRKSQRVFALDSSKAIRKNLRFIEAPGNTVAYTLNSPYKEDHKHMLIIHNANRSEAPVRLPIDGQWKIIGNEFQVKEMGVDKGIKFCSNTVNVAPLSTYILIKSME